MYCLCSVNKGPDQLRSYCGFVFTYADCWFSHAAAHIVLFNPFLTNGLSHQYQLGKSTVSFRGFRCDFEILFNFSMKFL